MKKGTIIRLYLVFKKGGKCLKCGYSKNLHSLSFHHRDSKTKLFPITTRECAGYSIDKLKKEVDKCDLLCQNCHQEKHSSSRKEKKKYEQAKAINKEVCNVCNKKLLGRQKKYCSKSCKAKFHANGNRKAQEKRKVERMNYFIKLYGGKCKKCGYKKNKEALCFHHRVEKTKRMPLNSPNMIKSIELIKKEAKKCDLLCQNCHQEHHFFQKIECIAKECTVCNKTIKIKNPEFEYWIKYKKCKKCS